MPVPDQMIAVAIAAPGGPEMLTPRTAPVPALRDNEVLIRVAAAGINYPDLLQRQGLYNQPAGHSAFPGLEVSGEIAALDTGVRGLSIGDRVVALCNGGGYAEYVAVPAGQVLRLPAGKTLVEGAAIPETWFTIQQTLVMRAGIETGMSVLVHGAAGGIGSAAIQMAALHGARPIAVVSGPEKAAYARSMGAVETIDHSREEFVARTLDLTGGRGADRIVTIAGGDMLARNMHAAARNGAIVQLASLNAPEAEIPLGLLLGKALTLIGSTLRPQSSETKAAIARGLTETVWPAFAAGRLPQPKIRSFALAEAVAAHQAMEQRASFGKIVLVTPFGQIAARNEMTWRAGNDNSIAPG